MIEDLKKFLTEKNELGWFQENMTEQGMTWDKLEPHNPRRYIISAFSWNLCLENKKYENFNGFAKWHSIEQEWTKICVAKGVSLWQ